MKKYLFLCLLFCLFLCCSKKKNIESNSMNPLSTISVDFDLNNSQPVDNLIDTMFLIPLETTDEALLGNNVTIKIHDSLIYAHTPVSSFIVIYDIHGKLKQVFDRKGEGPEEYLDIENFFVTNDGLYVYSRGLRKIKQYDFNNKFVKEVDLSAYPFCSQVILYQDQYLCYYENPPRNYSSIYIVNQKGELIDSYFEDRCYGTGETSCITPMAITSEGIVANFALDYTTYIYNGKDWVANMQFDFGDFNMPAEQKQALLKVRGSQEISDVYDKITRIDNIADMKDWTYYQFLGVNWGTFINKKTGKQLSMGKGLFSHFNGSMGTYDDYFIGVLNSGYLTKLFSDRISLYKETISLYEQQYLDLNIDDEDNPVLCFFKLKN